MDKKKNAVVIGFVALLVLSVFNALPASSWVYPDGTIDNRYEKFGPRCDRLLIKMYSGLDVECAALQMGEIDVMDWPLTRSWRDQFVMDPSIKLLDYGCDLDEIVLEINNNPNMYLGNPPNPTYPNPIYPNPCSVLSFRRALAYLVDRISIIADIDGGLGYPMYTEVPPCFPAWQHPDIRPGGTLEALTYPYNPIEAARLLNEDGFPIGPDGWRYWDRNGNKMKDTGEELELKFIFKSDDPKKRHIGDWIYMQLQSDPIKINVHAYPMSRTECIMKVMDEKDFHLFIGDRNLRKDLDYLYEMKHSQMYWHWGICPNYIFFNDTEYDYWAEKVKFATTIAEAVEAALKCQERYAIMVGSIPIECRDGIKAMKKCYSGGTDGVLVSPDDGENQYRCQSWKGFVNGYWAKCSCGGAKGINSWWTFLNAYPEGHLLGDGQNMTIRYGFCTSGLWSLNPIYAHDYWEWEVLNKVYDTLLKEDPYTLEDMPWIAKNWTIGTWFDLSSGQEKTKIRLTLQESVTWQDGTPLTVADVKFTIEELPRILAERGLPPPWWHQKVKFVQSCDIMDACNIEVLLKVKSIWALQWIGGLKILPKHIWKPIVESGDPTGFAPDPNLIGCGPWKFVTYDIPGQYIFLVVNRGYFRWLPVHVNVHISDPPEYRFAQRVLPNTDFTVSVTLHNGWVNPIPNSADAPAYGLLTAHKYVWLVHTNGTKQVLADAILDLLYCTSSVEYFPVNLKGCSHNQIKVAVYIEGPTNIEVTKEGSTIIVPNPWLCKWINYTFNFWVTIKEDIAGSTYYDDIGLHGYSFKDQLPTPDGQVDTVDVTTCSAAFGSLPGYPKWNSVADVIRDYIIGLGDVFAVSKLFGWKCGAPYIPRIYDVAVINVTTSKKVVCQGYPIKVNVTVQNQGNDHATFSVQVNYTSHPVKTRTVSLDPGVSETFTLIVIPETFVFEELWRKSVLELRSVDVSQDGTYVAFLSNDTIDIVHDGTIIASCSLPGNPETHWLDATQDMNYIAITNGTGVEFYGFDGSTLQRMTGTTLGGKTTKVRLSEDMTCAVALNGTRMNAINATTGNVLWSYDAGAEKFVCDGDDNLNYIIGGTQTEPYKYFILKNLGNSYQPLFTDSMSGSINDVDSTQDGKYFAFGSDAGEYLLLRRIGDTIETVLNGTVQYGYLNLPVQCVEIGNGTLLVGAQNLVNMYDFNGSLILHHEFPLRLQIPEGTKPTIADYDSGLYVMGTNLGNLCFMRELGQYGEISLGTEPVKDVRIENSYIAVAQGDNIFLLNYSLTPKPLSKGDYTLIAFAEWLIVEGDTGDNKFTDGLVTVSIVGDISSPVSGVPDGKVDMIDLWEVAKRFGRDYPHPEYDPIMDIDGNDKIDMTDLWIAAKNFGKIDP